MNVRRILVGLDGSPREALVLAAAQDLALRFDAHLLLLRAIGLPPEIPAQAWQSASQSASQSLRELLETQARQGLEHCKNQLCEAVQRKLTSEVIVASPWQALCLAAQAHSADLIVIGSHGYGGVDRILGTTAARVVNHALCSVFVVRAAEPRIGRMPTDSREPTLLQ